jgi:ATP-dependent helicase HrpB
MLPVEEALPALKAALAKRASAVLIAPPGAGKTTVTPLALMDEPWVAGGKLIVLEPRRLAARAAAERMASVLGEKAGQRVGYRMRLASRVSAATRIEVVTEGVFSRMIMDDPGLEGVAAVLFDEFHERSLDADLGLAFARDAQRVLRPDLRLLVMSATLDPAPAAALLDDAPIIESQGRTHPVETHYLGRDPSAPLPDQVARAVLRALAQNSGGVLVFLPGQREIEGTAERLAGRLSDPTVDIEPLYGALDPTAQDLAIARPPPGRRKVVLSTAIAQTSLTIEGVRVVIDSGLSRVARYDPASGLSRLETVRVSAAAADQRRGRAGRTEPGVCYRLWDERETKGLAPFDRPEILETDLARLALDLARWGTSDIAELALLDAPPKAALAEAQSLLARLGALDAAGALTPHGRRMAELPLPPRLAHMVLEAASTGQARRAARIAALIIERGLGGNEIDLELRLEAFERNRSQRARDARALADRWAAAAGPTKGGAHRSDGLLVAQAYPERIAKARGGPGQFQLATGRGAILDSADHLARASWLAIADLGGGEARDRIRLAAPLEAEELKSEFAGRLVREERLEAGEGGRWQAKEVLRLERLVIEERLLPNPDPALIAGALVEAARRGGLAALLSGERAKRLRDRGAFLRSLEPEAPDLSDEALMADLEGWLAPVVAGKTSLQQIDDRDIEAALRLRLGYEAQRWLDAQAPEHFTAPTGSRLAIDYAAEGGPRADVRAQELFGLREHPMIAGGRVPLVLGLLSPAHRPIQLTKDLPGFWRGAWREVRKEMRGRYPKHEWPEDPAAAAPTTRAKPRKA